LEKYRPEVAHFAEEKRVTGYRALKKGITGDSAGGWHGTCEEKCMGVDEWANMEANNLIEQPGSEG